MASVLLAGGLALGRAIVVPWALGILAGEYVLALFVRETAASFAAAAYGAGLLLVAELAFWSLELRLPARHAPGLVGRRAFATAALVFIALGVGLAAAAVSGVPMAGSLGLLAVGIGALVAAIAVATAMIWRPEA